jgi:hypothetical protein
MINFIKRTAKAIAGFFVSIVIATGGAASIAVGVCAAMAGWVSSFVCNLFGKNKVTQVIEFTVFVMTFILTMALLFNVIFTAVFIFTMFFAFIGMIAEILGLDVSKAAEAVAA